MTSLLMKLSISEDSLCLTWLYQEDIKSIRALWLLTPSYTAIPKNIRRQAKMLYVWYPKNRTDLNTIHKESNVIETPVELANVKKQLKLGKYTCLIMRMEHQELIRFVEFCNKTVTTLLSRDYRFLSRDYNTPAKRLQYSCQEITALLSRDYSAPAKRSQNSCQEITALLPRDYSTPVKRLQHSCQQNITKW